MPKFEAKESFQHKFAKELLHKWITEKWSVIDQNTLSTIEFIDDQTKREILLRAWQTDFVFMEYPITEDYPYLIDEQNSCSKINLNCQYRSTLNYSARWLVPKLISVIGALVFCGLRPSIGGES